MSQFKEKFIELYQKHIHREGADKLLEYLCGPQSDFFTAPASTRFHGSYSGGLVEPQSQATILWWKALSIVSKMPVTPL